MKIITWNCQGIGGDLTVDNLLEQNRLHTPDMVILLETKNKSRNFIHLKRRLGMDHWFFVEPRGIGGGICVFWRDATPQWQELSKRIGQERERCLLIGDFNDILCNDEKEGGNYRPAVSLRDFRNFVAREELMDLGYEGYPFTWRNNRESMPIQQRLDRGLATMGWYEMYPNTKIKHVLLEGSDHALLLLSTKKEMSRKGRQFSFDGRWSKLEECRTLESLKGIGDTAIKYFSVLFQSGKPDLVEEIQSCMESRLSTEDNRGLTTMVTECEIMEAAYQIPPMRAPGPDGFSGCFYQDHWDTVGPDVIKIVKAFWHSGTLLRSLNHTNLVLIPKMKCPKNMSQYRPIALCNVIYKIIAKVLTNRLKRVMPKVIGENQSAFVAGKQIQDNILVVHEALHSLIHQKSGDQPGMAIKLDMAKAYDRIEWDFLLGMMCSLGFEPIFCKWIKECISFVSFSVLINGTPTGFFRPNRGLRQGDPLSPYLFLLCTEGFSMLIRRGLERGALHGFKISSAGAPLTHLFFADDSVVFGNASVEEAENIVEVLKTYARGSGQEINLNKSSVFFGANTSKKMRANIVDSLMIQSKQGFGKYLGLQADFGHSKKAVFAEIRDKIEARMSGWAEQFLSQAGKEILVKNVAMALPNYAMSCFKLPIGDIQCVNLAFLAKIGWRITLNPMSLLASVLRDKYFPGKSFGEAPKGKNTSWGWKGLDLIDSDTKVWRTDLIANGFHRDDVSTILSIPLSNAGSNDRLVWHYATNGIYSVKSGYSMALKLMDDGALGRKGRGNPSECNKLKMVWNNIWRLQDMTDADDICQDFAFGLWRLWKNRNDVVFKGIYRQPLDILEAWKKSSDEYKASLDPGHEVHSLGTPKTLKVSDRICTKWKRPRFGTIKINTDAAWCKDTLRMGVGWLGRDFAGLLQAAGGSGIGFSHSAAAAEASAIRFALLSCIDHGFDNIIIESDARLIIMMLKKEILVDFSIECILDDIEVLAQKLGSVSFAFVPREGNRAAHSVAKYVFKEGRSFSWDCIGPEFLFNFLAKDVNLSIRL
ncbi:unnamed protein product [Malus baccata var. baccata]